MRLSRGVWGGSYLLLNFHSSEPNGGRELEGPLRQSCGLSKGENFELKKGWENLMVQQLMLEVPRDQRLDGKIPSSLPAMTNYETGEELALKLKQHFFALKEARETRVMK